MDKEKIRLTEEQAIEIIEKIKNVLPDEFGVNSWEFATKGYVCIRIRHKEIWKEVEQCRRIL